MSEVSELLPLVPYVISGISLIVSILFFNSYRQEIQLIKQQVKQQGEQIKQQGRARFLETHYPPIIENLKDALLSIKGGFKQGHTGDVDAFFEELSRRRLDGTLGMINPLNEQIHNGLIRIVEYYIPALNTIQNNLDDTFQEIPKKWILLLIDKSDEFLTIIPPQTFVSQCNFIWKLWRNEYDEAKKEFDEICERNLKPEDNNEFLRTSIFREIEEEADKLWLPVQNGFNTLYKEMCDWIEVQAVVPMEESLAEITEELRAS